MSIVIPEDIMSSFGINSPFTSEMHNEIFKQIRYGQKRNNKLILDIIPKVNIEKKDNTKKEYKYIGDLIAFDNLQRFGDFTLNKLKGRGAQGSVYTINEDNNSVLKILLAETEKEVIEIFIECIIQVLCHETLKGLEDFHYSKVGKIRGFYKYENIRNDDDEPYISHWVVGILMEPHETTLYNYVKNTALKNNPNELSVVNCMSLYQIINAHKYLASTIKFNHNDMKIDNIMLNKTNFQNSNGIDCFQTYLIDFGNSYIEYNGYKFSTLYSNYNPIKDIIFFIFYILQGDNCGQSILQDKCTQYIDPNLYDFLTSLLISSSPKINDFYTGNKYSKTNPWIEIHRQVEEFVTDTNYSFELHNQIIEFTKNYLRNLARGEEYSPPFYFGRSKRSKKNKKNLKKI